MNSVERVKRVCKERGIPIYRMESDLKFANGYIGQLRKGVFPANRLAQIAQYLSLSTDYLMGATADAQIDDAEYELKQLEKQWEKASDAEREKLGVLIDLKRESLEDLRLGQMMMQRENAQKGIESDAPAITDREIRAAFFNGHGEDLSEDEQDALWADAQAYMEFKLSQRKKKGE